MQQRFLEYAATLDRAAQQASAIAPFEAGLFDLPTAYAIQSASIELRKRRGEKVVGVKMGFTSQAKMRQMGVDELIYGRLTDQMQIAEGSLISLDRFIHARVEPELAFLLKDPLGGNVSLPAALSAVQAIAPALEIIDSRYQDFKFNLPCVIADNASASSFVVGAWSDPRQAFENLGIVLSFDGQPRQFGSTAAILGHPLRALCHAARLAASESQPLPSGTIILAGAASAAEPLVRGRYVQAEFQNLGSLGFHVAP
jgi:2-oxo-3-hexenedioate decarboxylase